MNNSVIVSNDDIKIDDNLRDSISVADNESIRSLITSPVLEEGIFIKITDLKIEQFIKDNSPRT
jgi:hypothetical protein